MSEEGDGYDSITQTLMRVSEVKDEGGVEEEDDVEEEGECVTHGGCFRCGGVRCEGVVG